MLNGSRMPPSPHDPKRSGAKWEAQRISGWQWARQRMRLGDVREGFRWFMRTFFGYVGSRPRDPLMAPRGERPTDVRPTLRFLRRVFFGVKPGAAFGEDFRHGRWRWVTLILLAVVALGLVAWQGPKVYRIWHRDHLILQAREALARKDYRSASFAARNVLVSDGANLEACRVMADIAERAGSRDALWWRSRVATLDPLVATNFFEWAGTALRFRDPETAGRALAGIPRDARGSEAFHALAASLAASVGELGVADRHLAEAIRLNPSNSVHRFNLACVQLESTNTTTLVAGRQTMVTLRGEKRFRLSATRALLAEAMRTKDRDRAVALVGDLKADPSAILADRLVCLDALRHMRSREAPALLDEIKKAAVARAANVAAVISWMNSRGLAGEAISWAATLPPTLASQAPVPLTLAESRESLRDWDGLVRFLNASKWEEMEYARLAMLARAQRQQGNAAASKTHWQLALTMARGRLEPMEMLSRLAELWGWSAEHEETLWLLAATPGTPRWPFQALYRHYRLKGDSRGLLRVFGHILERDPTDLVAQNNEAMLRLLLGVETEKASQRSRELWEKTPRSASVVSTQAFALHLAGRTREAVKLMETLPEAELRRPGSAVYYGLLLAEQGSLEKSRTFLELAKDASLLPEEKVLVARARRKAGLP